MTKHYEEYPIIQVDGGSVMIDTKVSNILRIYNIQLPSCDWFYLIKSGDGFNTRPIFSGYFDRPSEATEAAILYTLTKLI